MFKPGTVFIVGAGASAEFDFPQGVSFREKLANKIDFSFSRFEQNSGDINIVNAIRVYAEKKYATLEINFLLNKAWQLKEAMGVVSSIDTYLDIHKGDRDLETIGKMAILSTILEAENRSKLYYLPHEQDSFSFNNLSDTWLAKFTEILIQSTKIDQLDQLFQNVSFVCFNYDRCIENFLAKALEVVYSLTSKDAQSLVSTLKIYHPYGMVGDIPWITGPHGSVTFGKELNGRALYENIKRIKTFSEQIEEAEALDKIKEVVNQAETLVFLGMAYHKQNLELISQTAKKSEIKRIYGTAYGFSDSDTKLLENRLRKVARSNHAERLTTKLHHNSKCSDLFDENRVALSVS